MRKPKYNLGKIRNLVRRRKKPPDDIECEDSGQSRSIYYDPGRRRIGFTWRKELPPAYRPLIFAVILAALALIVVGYYYQTHRHEGYDRLVAEGPREVAVISAESRVDDIDFVVERVTIAASIERRARTTTRIDEKDREVETIRWGIQVDGYVLNETPSDIYAGRGKTSVVIFDSGGAQIHEERFNLFWEGPKHVPKNTRIILSDARYFISGTESRKITEAIENGEKLSCRVVFLGDYN